MKNKALKIFALIVGGWFLFAFIFWVACLYGNSGFAQEYRFEVSKNNLISAVKDFKAKNTLTNPPSNYGAVDYLDTVTSHYLGYIYYSEQQTVVCFYIDSNPDEPNEAYINLLSINEGLADPVYKLINRDFDRAENLAIKKEFKERFLDKLNLEYQDKGNGNFVFWK